MHVWRSHFTTPILNTYLAWPVYLEYRSTFSRLAMDTTGRTVRPVKEIPSNYNTRPTPGCSTTLLYASQEVLSSYTRLALAVPRG